MDEIIIFFIGGFCSQIQGWDNGGKERKDKSGYIMWYISFKNESQRKNQNRERLRETFPFETENNRNARPDKE